jgi:hypothetical protein
VCLCLFVCCVTTGGLCLLCDSWGFVCVCVLCDSWKFVCVCCVTARGLCALVFVCVLCDSWWFVFVV